MESHFARPAGTSSTRRAYARSRTVVVGALMIVAGAAGAAAQFGVMGGMPGAPNLPPIARGTGVIIGRAIEGSGTRPVAGAIVTLSVPGAAPVRVMADSQGQFAFR